MSGTTVEKETCAKCGVDVRENTQFCYNCGAENAPEEKAIPAPTDAVPKAALDSNAKAALDDLAAKLKSDEPEKSEKLAKAADRRKKARVDKRKVRTYRWEPAPPSSVTYVMVSALLVAFVAGVVVVVTVFVK